ncbi:hypothetical protein [Caballeronia sp. LZ032]|uniref:hypothetical protein n=1 Tax=Caballeronia sp. LZ032 TaxID=3038565 RepID=UPI00285DDF7C|nr:hypothetical protein [Caballeronia sp. LZ032]MDR5879219.1 hypothetical protein [Caballeronia sp. LZ032]
MGNVVASPSTGASRMAGPSGRATAEFDVPKSIAQKFMMLSHVRQDAALDMDGVFNTFPGRHQPRLEIFKPLTSFDKSGM